MPLFAGGLFCAGWAQRMQEGIVILPPWLDLHVTCNLTIRLNGNGDPKPVHSIAQSLPIPRRCRVQRCSLSRGKKRMEFLFHMPVRLDPDKLETDVRAKLPQADESQISIRVLRMRG
jgi:hypothetical protein